MVDFNSKYTGDEVESMLDVIESKQDVIEDLDTIREGASRGATALQSIPEKYVTETELESRGFATTTDLSGKVDKQTGKGLSTEDFTTYLKNKLEELSNYDDRNLTAAVNTLRQEFDTLLNGDTSTAIETFNEIIAFLDGVSESDNLASIIASIEQQIANKQDKIADLENINEKLELINRVIDEEGYLYSNGEKVDMRFTRSLLPVGTSIPANANLNTIEYVKIGKYYCSLNADAETITNCPVKVAFSMEVFNPLGTNVDDETTKAYTYRMRVLTQYNSGQQYLQFCRTGATPGVWTYDSWYVTVRSKSTLNSNKKGSSSALGSATQGVYLDSTGTLAKMTYTLAKSVPSNAVFTDTNTKVTAVGNHYSPEEDESKALNAPDGEVVVGLKRDAAGHIVGISTAVADLNADVYIADFTMVDIEMAIENATENVGNNFSVDADGTKLWDAIGAHKQIVIPYSNYADVGGYYIVTSAYHDGVGHINLSIFTGYHTLNLRINKDYLLTNNKLNFNADSSVEQSIDWWFSYMTNEELFISTNPDSDSIVKRNSNGGIEATTIDANFFRDTQGITWTTPTSSSETQADADYVFQEQLKSGQNIKTVNNQSLLGSGNINIEGGNAVYITPFSVDDLFTGIDFALANPDRYYHLDASIDLIHAVREDKIILIPYRQDPGYISAIRATNDGEAIYLTIARETTLIELELDNEYLYNDEIYLTADKIFIEKISYFAEPDTIVKRSDSGGVNATAWHDDTGTTWVTPTSSQDTKEGADYILQEYIPDLDDIRDGASKGATALQSEDADSELSEPESNYYTKSEVNDLLAQAITTTLNTAV